LKADETVAALVASKAEKLAAALAVVLVALLAVDWVLL
jgi:hypothetical protein